MGLQPKVGAYAVQAGQAYMADVEQAWRCALCNPDMSAL